MAFTQYKFTPEQFQEVTGKTIESYASLDESEIQAFINKVSNQIYGLINKVNAISAYVEDNLSAYRLDSLIKAQIYHAEYMLLNSVDPMAVFGIDRFTNQVISQEEIAKRFFCTTTIDYLGNAGFFYRGIW